MSIQVALWGSNIAGGFLRSAIEQDRDASYAYNLKLAQLADRLGYDAMLLPVRYIGGIGGGDSATGQLDPVTTAAALAASTERIRFISAVLPGFIPPVTLAKMGATIDHISSGRWHVNLVTGWFQEEQEMFGLPWIAHEERYARSEEYLEILKGLWQQETFSFEGRYYSIKEGRIRPFPYQRPYPAIFQGGNSQAARSMAGRLSDWYFMNGAPLDEIKEQIREVSGIASSHGRTVRFAVNAFVVARETEQEARAEYDRILELADRAAIRQFQERAKGAKGMWGNASSVSDFVANNEGFRTGLIGSYDQVARKIKELESAGVQMLLTAYRFPLQETVHFHDHVLPLIRDSRPASGLDASSTASIPTNR
ncbi:LLM class flavin-dependent oxidoreductase [Paenibacillus beijingensis]|uniref:Alkanesulfonate monooxygenase n=1 Tax=Paenibacillus beijingensis TaxID=1126833 RepID=A0A0D5NI39_9BACL|nr:LLM class flavin-dependent oxidoreductase [Paenibacillus beijingensis]AJY74775.1 alkanesulfonate monooxygenase [Paenibacillus beijingensis]